MDVQTEIHTLSNFFQKCVVHDKVKADEVESIMLKEFINAGYDSINIQNLAGHSYLNDLIIKDLYKSVFDNYLYDKEDVITYRVYENIQTVYRNNKGIFLQVMGGKLLNTEGQITPSSILTQPLDVYDVINETITIIDNDALINRSYVFSKKTKRTISDVNFQTSILAKQNNVSLPGLSFFIGVPANYAQYKNMIQTGDRQKLIDTLKSSYGRYRFVDRNIKDFSDDTIYNLIMSALQDFERDGIFVDPEESEYILDDDDGIKYDVSIDATNEVVKTAVVNPDKRSAVKYIGEYNPYYRRLYKIHKIKPEDSRTKNDFSILKYELTEGMDQASANLFIRLYDNNAKMFLAKYHLYASRLSNGSYFEYCAFVIFTMTVVNFLRVRTDERFTIDGMYDRDIINKFTSYGISGLRNIPIAYKRLILKEMPNFIRVKGSREVITHILSIFGVNNIDLVTYNIFKEYNKYDIYFDLPSYTEHLMIGDKIVITYKADDENDPDPTVYKNVTAFFAVKNDDEDINNIVFNILEETQKIYPDMYKIIIIDDKLILSSYNDIDYTRIKIDVIKADGTVVHLTYLKDDIDSKSVDVNIYSTVDKENNNLHDVLKKRQIEQINDGLDMVRNMDHTWKITKTELLKNEKFSALRTKHISIGNKINLVELSSKVSVIFYELKKIEPLINSYKMNLHFDTYENRFNDNTSLFNIIVGLLVMNLKRYGLTTKIPKDISDIADIESLHLETFRITDDTTQKFSDDKYGIIKPLSNINNHNQYPVSISNSINANLAVYDQYFTDEIPDYIRQIQNDPYLRIKYRDPGEVINDFKEGFRERFMSEETTNLFFGYKTFDEYLEKESPYLLEIINRSISDKKENDLFVYLAKVLSTQVSNKINWVELDGKLLADYVTDIINTFRSYLIHIMNYDDKSVTYSVGEYGIESIFLYDKLELITGTVEARETLAYFDQLNQVLSQIEIYDSVLVEDEVTDVTSKYSVGEEVKLFTETKLEATTMKAEDDLYVTDYLTITSNIKTVEEPILFETVKITKQPII